MEDQRRGNSASDVSLSDWCVLELKKHGFVQRKQRVFFATSEIVTFSSLDIIYLLYYLQHNNLSIGRLCLHRDQSYPVQEMLIVQNCKHDTGPLRQENGHDISFHCFFGELMITHPKRKSTVILRGSMNESARFGASEPREITSLTENAVFLEICKGPFDDADTEWGLS